MGVLRASVIMYSDLQLLGYLLGHATVCYIDLLEAAQAGHPYGPLYRSGIRYEREPPGSEVWQTTRMLYATRAGDCEDVSCVRAAELWSLGETLARPTVRRISPRLRHIQVQRADGTIEDPSLILGMHAHSDPTGAEARAALAAVKPPILTPDEPLPWHMPPLAQRVA